MRRILSSMLLVLAGLTAGCASHGGGDPQTGAALEAEQNGEETHERKAPPFFIYRPGAGLTIEDPEGRWRIRL